METAQTICWKGRSPMATPGDDGPSVFAKYIDDPKIERPTPLENTIKQPPSRREDPKIFLEDILSNGPAPATLIIKRGAERGFSKRQITYAREQMKLIALKGPGTRGAWFWVLPHDNRAIPPQQATPNISISLNQ
jgi:hypothetical protein